VVGGAGSLQVGPDQRLLDTPEFPAQFREEASAQADALAFYRTIFDVRWTYVARPDRSRPAAVQAASEQGATSCSPTTKDRAGSRSRTTPPRYWTATHTRREPESRRSTR
jgi:hypothetical protein